MPSIADLRQDYQMQSLSKSDVHANPIDQFRKWWDEALNAQIVEPNAMTLATASADGLPAARIVLLKALSEEGFSFFTNYNSYKALQLAENPRACLVFLWKELERQVRITGLVEKLPPIVSDEYFSSRPIKSQIGAWASPQSQAIENRSWLENEQKKYEEKFAAEPIKRPGHWGGYIVKPVNIEFWQGRRSRLHDRIQYVLNDTGDWRIERLAP